MLELTHDLATLPVEDLRKLTGEIGNTPVVRVRLPGVGNPVALKLEGANPGASSKDRPAHHILAGLPPGTHVVDATSGNWGVSVAWLARAWDLRFTAVSDPRITPENLARLRRLGAALEIVEQRDETGGFLLTRIRRAREIASARPRTIWLNQYGNPGNPEAHYRTTGPELLEQMGGRLDVVFIPASTGGTLAGVGRYLREHSPQTLLVAVDGAESSMFGCPVAGARLVNGLGSARPSELLERNSYDYVVRISAQAAFGYCRALAAAGVLVGGSSGAAVAAAAIELRGQPSARALCLCPDHGDNYRSTVFDDGWLLANGLSLAEEALVLA